MSGHSQYELLKQRRFLPFFLTQFLGAFNDNVYKNALVILVAFHAASLSRLDANTLSNLAQALFILPFFLFSRDRRADRRQAGEIIPDTNGQARGDRDHDGAMPASVAKNDTLRVTSHHFLRTVARIDPSGQSTAVPTGVLSLL
ncbi:MAG TPA: hypothetical protein VF387_00275 [Gemmatimonadaceae bacterium]